MSTPEDEQQDLRLDAQVEAWEQSRADEARLTDPDLVTAKERIQQWTDYQQAIGPLDEVRLLHHG